VTQPTGQAKNRKDGAAGREDRIYTDELSMVRGTSKRDRPADGIAGQRSVVRIR
jgi:hypothetical protein